MDKCPFCGSDYKEVIGNTKSFVCGTFLFDSPRGDHQGYDCLLHQLATLRSLVREMAEAAKIVLENPYYKLGWIERTATLAEILSRPEVEAVMEENP